MSESASGGFEVSTAEVAERLAGGEEMVILDVRTASEYRASHIPGSVHLPLDELAARYQELTPDSPIVVVCEHGLRSSIATHFLRQMGFTRCANVRHGLSDWHGPVEGMMR
jgi:rhodanese-related sulfurtransferase